MGELGVKWGGKKEQRREEKTSVHFKADAWRREKKVKRMFIFHSIMGKILRQERGELGS